MVTYRAVLDVDPDVVSAIENLMGGEGSRQRARSAVSVTLRPTPRTNLLKETGGRGLGSVALCPRPS